MPQTSTDYRHTIHINPLPTTIHHSPSCGDMHSDDRDAPQVWKNCMAQLWLNSDDWPIEPILQKNSEISNLPSRIKRDPNPKCPKLR
jgi:hypothetical protein